MKNPNNQEITSASRLVSKDLGEEIAYEGANLDELREKVTFVISKLLLGNMEKLMNVLYHIDVDEKRVREILGGSKPDKIAEELAEEVLKREFKKIYTRRKYR